MKVLECECERRCKRSSVSGREGLEESRVVRWVLELKEVSRGWVREGLRKSETKRL